MSIVVLDGYGLSPGDLSWDEFHNLEEDVRIYDTIEQDEVVERVGKSEIIVVNKIKLNRDTLSKIRHVKYIGVLATGYDIVDVEAAREFGMVVTNIPAYGTNAVAQFVFALLLHISSHVAHHVDRVKEGAWEEYNEFCFWEKPLMELFGKTLGIVGFGKIGQTTAKIAKAFGMNVIVSTKLPDLSMEDEKLKFVDIGELYENSDVISLHCPLFEETKGMINEKSIDKMKDGVIIINTSRGGLIVENDLSRALECGKVGAAGIDAMIHEPPKSDNILIRSKNCFVTPHIAWAPKESRERLMSIAAKNIADFKNGINSNRV